MSLSIVAAGVRTYAAAIVAPSVGTNSSAIVTIVVAAIVASSIRTNCAAIVAATVTCTIVAAGAGTKGAATITAAIDGGSSGCQLVDD